MKHRTRRLWQLRCMSLALGLGGALLIAELGLRWLGIGSPMLYQPDPVCGSRLRPHTRGVWTSEGFGRFAINSLGFRGPEFSFAKPSHTVRVCVLGDSFIEGLQVDQAETLCGQLERQLNASGTPSAPQYQVINCGVSGYGTAQERLLLEHYVLPLRPDVVMLGFYAENDVRNNHPELEVDPRKPYYRIDAEGQLQLDDSFLNSTPYQVASSQYERTKAYWINLSRVLQVLWRARQPAEQVTSQTAGLGIEQQLSAAVQEAIYAYREPQTSIERQAWEVTERLIAEVGHSCREHGVRLIVFSVSSSIQAYPDKALRARVTEQYQLDDLCYAERRLGDWCASQGIEFIPLASHLQQVADQTGSYLHGFSNTQLGLGHWSADGHQVAAEFLVKQFR